jgi:hypothetical protein
LPLGYCDCFHIGSTQCIKFGGKPAGDRNGI